MALTLWVVKGTTIKGADVNDADINTPSENSSAWKLSNEVGHSRLG